MISDEEVKREVEEALTLCGGRMVLPFMGGDVTVRSVSDVEAHLERLGADQVHLVLDMTKDTVEYKANVAYNLNGENPIRLHLDTSSGKEWKTFGSPAELITGFDEICSKRVIKLALDSYIEAMQKVREMAEYALRKKKSTAPLVMEVQVSVDNLDQILQLASSRICSSQDVIQSLQTFQKKKAVKTKWMFE